MAWTERLGDWWRGHRWWVIGALWAAVIVLGFWGLWLYRVKHAPPNPPQPELSDIAYETLRLFSLDVSMDVDHDKNLPLQIARFAAPLLLVLTTLQALIVLFYERWLLVRARRYRGHVVIAGYGKKGRLLAKQFLRERRRVVIIERDEDNPFLKALPGRGVPVVTGDAAEPAQLRRARVERASVLVCLMGDDRTNAQVAFAAQELAGRRPGRPLDCLVYIVDRRLCTLLTEQELESADADPYRMHFFNPFDRGARILLDESAPFEVAGNGGPHLLVVGFGPLSQSFVVQAVYAWMEAGRPGESFGITLIDRDAEERLRALKVHYPSLAHHCEVQGLSLDPGSPGFEEGAFLFDEKGGLAFTKAYILLGDESAALDAALTLLGVLDGRRLPIYLAIEQESRLMDSLRSREQASGAPIELHAFGLLDRVLQPGLLLGTTTEILARAIHEEYVRDQQQKGETRETNRALVPWKHLAEDLKESNRNQAEHIGSKLRQVHCFIAPRTNWDQPLFQFTPDEVESLARMEHQRFLKERVTLRTSPYMVSWEELDEATREQARQAVRHLPALLAKIGFRIQRQGG